MSGKPNPEHVRQLSALSPADFETHGDLLDAGDVALAWSNRWIALADRLIERQRRLNALTSRALERHKVAQERSKACLASAQRIRLQGEQ